MTPDCIKDLQVPAIKSLLLEELLGISNKRLRLILAGEHLDVNSSSSESEIETKPDDIISLDDITESSEICISDDNCMEIQLSERERLEMEIERPKTDKLKSCHRSINKVLIKKENDPKPRKKHRRKTIIKKEKKSETNADNPVMNVLNLLELQARARAIRSQLANEILVLDKCGEPSIEISSKSTVLPVSDGDDSANSVIFVSPKSSPVVLVHSESDLEENKVSNISEKIDEKPQPSNDVVIENSTFENIESTNEKPQGESIDDDDFSNDVLIVSEDSILDKDSDVLQQKATEGDTSEDNAFFSVSGEMARELLSSVLASDFSGPVTSCRKNSAPDIKDYECIVKSDGGHWSCGTFA
ncbi:hypothetical protein CBL_14396 [Carabus blaptoides fortunei]